MSSISSSNSKKQLQVSRVKVPKHDAKFSFRKFRERLDSIKPKRQPRGRFRDFRHSEGESKHNLGKYKFLSDMQVMERRKELEKRFDNVVIDISNYEGLNQGKDGACTLVSLIHMIWLSGAASKVFSRDVAYVLRYWRSYWKPETTDSTHADASPDIASTIDMSLRTGLVKDASFLNYVPIRSEGNREQSFNESFWVNDRDMLVARYNIKKVSDYDKITFVYQNAYLIERLLDAGHPIAVNALEHSRVAVGYDDTHLLFADSWDTKYYESNGTGTDVTNAGFSVVDKWLIYTWMRDIAYVEMREFDIDNTDVKSNANRTRFIRMNKSRRKSSRRASTKRRSSTKRASKRIRTNDDDNVVDLTGNTTSTKSNTRTKKLEDLNDDGDDGIIDLTNDNDFSSWIARDEFDDDELENQFE